MSETRDPQATVDPGAAAAFNCANAAFREGDWTTALAGAEAALSQAAGLVEAAVLKARCLANLGRLAEARDAYGAALRIDGANFSAWLELGNVSRRLGAAERAVQCYERAATCRPGDSRGHLAAARALEEMKTPKEIDRAAYHYHRAVVLSLSAAGKVTEATATLHHRMGAFRLEAGDAPRALEALRQAEMAAQAIGLALDDRAEILIDLADALLRVGLSEDAHRVMEQASLTEREATLTRLARVAYRFNLWPEAIEVLTRCVALHPASANASFNRADMLAKSWQLEEALAELDRAEAKGTIPETASASLRAHVAGKMGDADTALSLYQRLVDGGDDGLRSSVAMSMLYSDSLTPAEVAERHRRLFAALGHDARPRESFANPRTTGRPLRIGMVSADLHHQHPVNIFLQPMLANWNHADFPLAIYFTGESHDEQTRLAKSRAGLWREVPDERLARQIETDGIDILIDLSGHTNRQKMAHFARRMAPVQATFLGYPGSTGVPNMDWIFGDPVVTPPEHDPLYSERVARLPHTVFCFAPEADYPSPEFAEAIATRPLTFGSFNNIPKLTPRTIRLWSEVLSAVPGSRLVLKAPSFRDSSAAARFTGLFGEHGIGPERLEFRGPVALAEMMREYADIDIALDTVPYNGGTTTLQALWMGAPVVTAVGGHFVSRMGASFLTAAGLSDWVAEDDADYVAIAAAKARDPRALLDLKRALRSRLQTRPAWNAEAYIRAFENSLREIWAQWVIAGGR